MTILFKSKTGQYTITIPKDVVDATGWKKGDSLYVGKKEGVNSLFIEKNPESEKEKDKKKGEKKK
jgi:bifunctional DNA-binding transcriptional regulator/antitoxin component of YhaV-PrlF toxin-antitoxin module